MTLVTVRFGTVAVALLTALLVSSCGDASSPDEHAGPTETLGADAAQADTGQAVHNADDVEFAQKMIKHHQQAVEIAAMAQANSADPQVRGLANAFITTQTPQIQVFRAWLAQWGAPETTGQRATGSTDMPGTLDRSAMDRLEMLSGPEFDQLWLESMINHHQGAVTMSEAEIANGRNADAIAVAKVMIAGQQAEIDQMDRVLAVIRGDGA